MAATPGPWSVMAKPQDDGYEVVQADDRDTPLGRIAIVVFHDDTPKETLHNARLIAAVPDLLAACESVVAWFDADMPKATALAQCRAAIAKAKGGA